MLAGGCFWGMQDLIRRLDGVISTRVGYSGGDVPNATYRHHGTHAEAIEIVFDPARISYRKLLEFFFQVHDPTTRNRQGNDVGMSYRSAIFYTSDEQKRVAEDTIADVNASGLWPGKVVTEVAPAGAVLGGGARAPGLSRAHSERLHLPFRPAGVEAAGAGDGGPLRGRLIVDALMAVAVAAGHGAALAAVHTCVDSATKRTVLSDTPCPRRGATDASGNCLPSEGRTRQTGRDRPAGSGREGGPSVAEQVPR